jgi:hypothetical protein
MKAIDLSLKIWGVVPMFLHVSMFRDLMVNKGKEVKIND